MLKPIQNRNEADIYDCLSRDESFIMSDLENLGPWHKYGGSIHQELQRITSLSIQEPEQLLSSKRPQQITNRRTSIQQESKSQENKLLKKDVNNRTQIFKQKISNKKEISIIKQKQTQTLLPEKQNVGFFVKCYPERGLFNPRSSLQNFQTSKDYFEKIALKMMYGLNRKQEENDSSKYLNSSKKTIQQCSSTNQTAKLNGRRNYFQKKELKFNDSQQSLNQVIDSTITSLLQSQQESQSKGRIPFHKIINKKTLISFASQHQLLEREYEQSQQRNNRKMKRMVSS